MPMSQAVMYSSSLGWKFGNIGHCRFSRAADVWCMV